MDTLSMSHEEFNEYAIGELEKLIAALCTPGAHVIEYVYWPELEVSQAGETKAYHYTGVRELRIRWYDEHP